MFPGMWLILSGIFRTGKQVFDWVSQDLGCSSQGGQLWSVLAVFQPYHGCMLYSRGCGQGFLGEAGGLPERPYSGSQCLLSLCGDEFHPWPVGLVAVVPDEVPGEFYPFVVGGRQHDLIRVGQFDGV